MRIGLLLLVLFAGVYEVSADPAPREFFERNYAEAPNVAQKPLKGEVLSITKAPLSDAESPSEIANTEASLQSADSSAEPHDQPEQKEDSRAFPATIVSVYVNSKDGAHLTRVLSKALQVKKKDDVALTSIFHLGDYRNVPASLAEELEADGVVINPINEIPATLPISQSPAWLFQSRDGYRIVEGTLDIEQFYDELGNFREPVHFIDTSKEQATPLHQKLAGF
jgi:hypothetical protein